MAQQTINIGAAPNDGTGTPLRTSFDYTNQNFTELYAGGGVGTSTNTQVIFNDSGVLKGDAGLVYNKTTDALTVTGPLSVNGLSIGKGGTSTSTTNVAFGVNASGGLTAGTYVTSLGRNTNSSLTLGSSCTAVGGGALSNNIIGDNNTAVGLNALLVSTGDTNTAMGSNAGSTQTAGSNNAFFGNGAVADTTTGSNQYNYGNSSVATHKFRMGNLVVASGNVMIGVATAGANAALTLQIANGTAPTAGIAGGQLFVIAGVLKYMNSAGTTFTVTMV